MRASKPIMKSFLVVHIESGVGVVEVIVGQLTVRESGVDLTLIFTLPDSRCKFSAVYS